MRRMILSLTVLAALSLAGCNNSGAPQSQTASSQSAAQGTAPAVAATNVSGTVGLRQPADLSNAASLQIKLVDVSTQGAVPLATKTIAPVSNLPVQFKLGVKPGDVHPSDLYVVQAVLTDGERQYTMPLQAPVLTKGASSHVDIRLVAVPTAGEKMLADFKKVQAQIGGMKMSKGTALSKAVSRGWQIFRDKDSGDIVFIRELADYGKKGFTHTDYAYKGGKPWVVVQQKKPSQKASPSEIDRAGWNPGGDLMLKEKVVGGKTATLDADTAATLKKQAAAMFAQAKKEQK